VQDKRLDFIQTDAAINLVIRRSFAQRSRRSGVTRNYWRSAGLGFAISIETAQRVANQLITTGRVYHPYLGIRLIELTPDTSTGNQPR